MEGSLGRTLCILTGASRAFNRSLALLLVSRMAAGSALLINSSNYGTLRTLSAQLGKARPDLQVVCVSINLGGQAGLQRLLEVLPRPPDLQRLLLIHDAGTLGDVSKHIVDFADPEEVNGYWALNVTSTLCLTARILGAFPSSPGLKRTVVNISSLCAVKPTKLWSLYCTGKAARSMMFSVLAEEEPSVRVLSYAPGPLDTEIQGSPQKTKDLEEKQTLNQARFSQILVDWSVYAKKLLDLLEEDTFESGAHIDFFDE
ncbi:sepiapterin reductase-like [Trichosurus vulpecula]|uniref:sepiapterin reductase-like n=1 Tax=Trichosurus vulpecula TaxID=9337 RepID=UPI00186B32F3|nr:sepiapterin reductase-like [Trichosurus vulpecula]